MARILITGARAPAALELCRQFKAAGHEVLVADSVPFMLSGGSKAVEKAIRVTEPRSNPRQFAREISEAARREAIDLIIPTCEEVFYLGRFKSEIERETGARVFAPGIDILSELHSKWAFAELVRRTEGFGSDVRVPESWIVTGQHELPAVPLESLVLKPVYSRFAVETLVRPSVNEVAQVQMTTSRPWVAQRFIAGREMCCYAVIRDGAIVALSIYEPKWRAGKGAGIYFEPCANPKIVEFVAGLGKHFNMTGQVSFDFIEAGNDAVFVLECNPRATSGAHLFEGLARAFFGEPVQMRAEPRMVASAMVPFSLGRIRAGGLRAAIGFGRDFGRAKDVIWSWRDPWPAVYALAGTGFFLWQAVRRGVSATAATTLDISWDGGEIQ